MRAAALALILAGCSGTPSVGPADFGAGDFANPPLPGATVAVTIDGSYRITFDRPAWIFRGKLDATPGNMVVSDGSDAAGAYHETTFDWNDGVARSGAIRAYTDAPVVLLTLRTPNGGPNTSTFPSLTPDSVPPHHVTYQTKLFAPPSFTALAADSPWIFFDDQANAFVLSAASHFPNSSTRLNGPIIASGIDPAIATLPPGFEHTVALVAAPGINRALDTWGDALLARSGKARTASDATVDLERLGYWTDNGAVYYYNFDAAKGYQGTLTAVRDQLAQLGVPIGYLQLDSWWYPKGANAKWDTRPGGIFQYVAEPTLFPSGLAAFAQSLGLPLVTHSRWIDASSPYRTQFSMSNNVVTDAAYWTQIAQYLKASGVVTYEQDWLDQMALPATGNLADQEAFLDHMAAAMQAQGLSVQYCMPLPRHHLQSTKYPNLATIRTAFDRFTQDRWHDHLYVSKLEGALGVWPWVDVFMSSEQDNLLLATLSGGMVGVGDALGGFDADSLRKAVRSDGVIVKPDAPLVPLDQSFIDEALGNDQPLVASTFTDGNGVRAIYVFAFGPQARARASAGFGAASIVLDTSSGTAQEVPGGGFEGALAGGRGYWVVVPLAQIGKAFLGDAGKFVPLGRKRVTRIGDDSDGLHVELAFAPGEGPITVRLWSPAAPSLTAVTGSVSAPRADPRDAHLWLADVTPAGQTASFTVEP